MTIGTSRIFALAGLLVLALPAAAGAQEHGTPESEWCRRGGNSDRGYYCEVRETTVAAPGTVAVDARPNGGIGAQGWDRGEMLVRTRVAAWADTDAEARDIVSAVDVEIEDGRIRSTGPSTSGDRSWSASYELFVPRRSNLDFSSTNGGIRVADVTGTIEFQTTNGGVSLSGLAGTVRGRTQNGGVSVTLAGSSWAGDGLDVRTTNGGVKLLVPEGYSAHLETGTTNGGMHVDFPVTVQGRFGRTLSVDLGGGGATIRATTVNGGVSLQRP